VFGVDLKEIASRKMETGIPAVILKTVSYLKVHCNSLSLSLSLFLSLSLSLSLSPPPILTTLLLILLILVLGLNVEGVFRISGSASLIEYYKDRFDQGMNTALAFSYPLPLPALISLNFGIR
jgi:hypothetical protein